MQIHGFQKSTLLDYPKHLAATIFTVGCNLRCPFCHNSSLVLNPNALPLVSEDEIFAYLEKRIHILEGICITGGEPTLQKDLAPFISKLKSMGFKVKLDTNGTNPSVLKDLIKEHLLDYVAMDIKNSPDQYPLTCGNLHMDMDAIRESVAFLLTNPVAYEFRTTLVQEFHGEDEILSIGKWIQNAEAYYLQSYVDSGNTIQAGYHSLSPDILKKYQDILKNYTNQVFIRG